eukprot:796039-Heterocapsa_arctica.AAC.1
MERNSTNRDKRLERRDFHQQRNNNNKNKGKSSGNPRGHDGETKKCFKCGSDQHMIRDCDQPYRQPRALLATGAPPATTMVPP